MTDLATQPQADGASAKDAVEVDEAVEDATDAELEGSPAEASDTAEREPAADDAEATAEAAPAEEAEPAETADEAEPADDAEPAETLDEAAPADEAKPADDAEPADEAEIADDAEPIDAAEVADEAETESVDDIEPVDEADAEPADDAERADEADPEPTDDAEPAVETVVEADAPEPTDTPVDAEATAVHEAAEVPDDVTDAAPETDDAAPVTEDVAPEGVAPEADTAVAGPTPVDEPDPAAAEDAAPADVSPIDTDDARTVAVATAVLAPATVAAATDVDASDAADATAVLSAPAASATAAAAPPAGTDGAVYAWAEPDPQPKKKKRAALWLGIGAGVAVVGLVISSLLLIAPGTTVAGVPVGWMTPGAAAEAIEQQLAGTTVVLTGDGGDAEVTGAELGASVDAKALADAAFAEHPMWNPTAWFAETGGEVELDTATALDTLREAAPGLFSDPVDATLAYDGASTSYVSTPATPGTGIDVATVQQALQAAFEAGKTRVNLEPVIAEVPAAISTETAADTATKLNGMISNIGFYVGDERTVPVDRAVAASWLTVTPENGAFAITADAAAIQPVVDTLAATVDRSPENAVEITDRAGKVLDTIAAGQSGRQVGDTSGVAAAFAAQLAGGDPVYKLPVEEVPVSTTTLARNIVVDLSDQAAYFYENGVVVNSTRMSSGLPGHDTHTGNFRITAKLRVQNMGNPDLTKAPYYYTKNVPWVMYFNGDQALHGAYWHNNFGNRMSHGCVNLPVGVAEFLYQWAPMGTEVTVQN